MPAIEIWGPAVWTLFHTLIEQLNDGAFATVAPQMYAQFVKICRLLPCPECAQDATQFLARNPYSNIRSKEQFRNLFYIFHNWVNAKKRKPLFNYSNVFNYSKYNIIVVINRFISVYHTKGNMKMLNESFQRQLTLNSFKGWITSVISAFMPNPPKPVEEVKEVKEEEVKEETVVQEEVKEEEVKEETVVQEEVKEEEVKEESVVQEETVVQEEEIQESVVQESVVQEEEIQESVVQEEEIQEYVVQEEVKESVVQEEVKEEEVLTLEKPAEKEEEIKDEVKPKGKKGKKGKK